MVSIHEDHADAPPLHPRRLHGHGVNLVADEGGITDAVPVILLPGAGQTRHAWYTAANALVAQGFYVLSVDLRGHGDSDWASDGDYSIDAFVADLDHIVAHLAAAGNAHPPILVGASLGGIAALMFAAYSCKRLAGLVLVDVVPRMQPDGLQRIRAFMSAHADGFASVQEASDVVAAYLPHRPRPASLRGLERSLRLSTDGRWRWHWDPAFHASSEQRSAGGMFERMSAAAAKVQTPTLLVSGKNSEVVSHDGAHDLLKLMPHAFWVNVEDAAHMVAGDRNDAFIAALLPFIATCCHPTEPLSLL